VIDGFEVKIKRTDRKKTAEIQVLPEKTIEVTIPNNFSEERVEKLLAKKRTWIISKIKEVNERPNARKKEFVSGESFMLFGKTYRLKIMTEGVGVVSVQSDRILVMLPKGLDKEEKAVVAKEMLLKWYWDQAEKKFKSRLEFYSKKLGLEYSGFSVKDFKSRWGSCLPSGHISLNWRLVKTPTSIIDYVIVHELIHLEVKGHGDEFWEKVGHVLRDYKDRRAELKNLHGEMYSI
jgi:predicted metal-dependent hydrolase